MRAIAEYENIYTYYFQRDALKPVDHEGKHPFLETSELFKGKESRV